ncbi:di-heme oxidoredictase family protein [Marinobacterium sp. YM272]|uniref:di-heme oxidoreductase family protein n=1 Tax=Marinobacterium sp. YM272 TaxID=3421654 RepID=UPI003D7F9B2F
MAFAAVFKRHTLRACLLAFLPAAAFSVYAADGNPTLSGGDTTFTGANSRAPFSQPADNLSLKRRMDFVLGEAIFEKIWVPSPSSTTASDGLGPLHNARSCSQCHINDGRGHPLNGNNDRLASLLRLSVPADTPERQREAQINGLAGDPVYGSQLQPFAVAGLAPEGRVSLDYEYTSVELADGTVIELRKPVVRVIQPGYGDFDPALRSSFRIAPPMIGLGLLEQIPDTRLEALADPEDLDGDGISGRINRVYDRSRDRLNIGRFGWKAGQPTLAQQNASALNNDIGIGNPIYPAASGNCTQQQSLCLALPDGNTAQQGGLEASAEMMRVLNYYTALLAVPAAREQADPQVQLGRQVFMKAGCGGCHTPSHVTSRNTAFPELDSQTIFPYTDLLLHDMGPGLADEHDEFSASGPEWRTAPLWGLGLTERVAGTPYYLHDGRARTLLEAILWHGGEAKPARDHLVQLDKTDRDALIRFLESL